VKGRGLYSVSVVATDSAGFATTAVWNYRVVNRPRLTLRDSNGAVVPPTIRVPTGAPVTFVADIASDEPDTVIRSVVVYNDGGRYADGVEPCAAPPYCPTPIVVRKVWGGPAGKAGTVDDLRIVVEDQWGIQTEVAVHVEVYAATYMLANSECCSVNLGKSVQLSGQLLGVEDYKGEPGRRVTVQWRPVGSTSWQTLATPTTSSTGRFSGIRHTPHRNGTYRFTYAGVPDILGGSTVSVPAEVYPRVKGKFRHGGWIHRGHIARLDVHTTPAEPSSVWRLQRLNRHDHMVTVIKRRIPASRHTTFKMRLHRRGWHTYQVVRAATAAYGFSYSKVFVVYVK
jgi:5-hydroxyisourate hydrolase-like protein (transthyretin family)